MKSVHAILVSIYSSGGGGSGRREAVGRGDFYAEGGREGGQEGRGQWEGGISMMECVGGHRLYIGL